MLHAVLPRDARLLLFNNFLATIPIGYLQVSLPLYLSRGGLDPALIGLLYGISGATSALLVGLSGVLADRLGRRPFVFWGTLLPVLSYLVLAFTSDPAWLILASVAGGFGLASGAAGALTNASFDALLAERTAPSERAAAFAWSQGVWSFALAIGSASAAGPEWLRSIAGSPTVAPFYTASFIVMVVVTVLAAAVVLPIRESHRAPSATAAKPTNWLPRRSAPSILRYALGIALLGFGLGIATQLLPLWFQLRFGVDEATLGPWYSLGQMLSISSIVAVPWLAARFSSAHVVLVAQVLGGVSLALISAAPLFEVGALLLIVRHILANLAWPLQQALLMHAVAPEERASAAGIGFAAWSGANALGPVLGGWLLASGALAAPLLVGAAAYVSAGVVFGRAFRGQPSSAPRPLAH